MKTAVVFGCGSGNGKIIIDILLSHDYQVCNVGSQSHHNCKNIEIAWQDVTITNLHRFLPAFNPIDFVFFNQNSSSLNCDAFTPKKKQTVIQSWQLLKNWQHSHWLSCQMPFLVIKYLQNALHPDSKIGWMLSSMMYSTRPDVEKFPDYSSQKYFNYLAMIAFGKHYQTFGILPDFSLDNSQTLLAEITAEVCNTPVNCTLFDMKSL